MKTRRLTLPLFLALLLLGSCMGDRLTDSQIDDKIAEATCGSDQGAADDNEGCDDGNDSACDSCEACGKRQVLRVESKADLLVMQTKGVDALKVAQDDKFSIELWFKLNEKVVNGSYSLIAGRFKDGSDRFLGVGVLGVQGGNAISPVCTLNAKDTLPSAQAAATVVADGYSLPPNAWHHIICAYDGTRNVIGVAADLYPLDEETAKVPPGARLKGGLFADDDIIVIGYLEQTELGKAVPFAGLIDEVRWSNTYPDKQPEFRRRYDDDDDDTVFLFHLDGPATGAAYQVKSADGQFTAASPVITHAFSFGKDNCFDSAGHALLCELVEDADQPQWCSDVAP